MCPTWNLEQQPRAFEGSETFHPFYFGRPCGTASREGMECSTENKKLLLNIDVGEDWMFAPSDEEEHDTVVPQGEEITEELPALSNIHIDPEELPMGFPGEEITQISIVDCTGFRARVGSKRGKSY